MNPLAKKLQARVKELRDSIAYRTGLLRDHERRQLADAQKLMDSSLPVQEIRKINTQYVDRKKLIDQLKAAISKEQKQLNIYLKELSRFQQPRLI